MKLEHHSIAPSVLEDEVDTYRCLTGNAGFPRVHWHGHHEDFNVLVLELLGPNLEDLFVYCGNQFSLKTTLMLADQLLHRVEVLHSNNYLHRDIKPENFLMGMGKQGNVVYMTDMGLAFYRRPGLSTTGGGPVRNATARPLDLVGTCQYASINGHLGESKCHSGRVNRTRSLADLAAAQCYRDDLESLGYMLVYFMRGNLPWQALKKETKSAEHRRTLKMKEGISVSDLCTSLPSEFADYMTYVKDTGDEDRPDYRYLRTLFDKLYRAQGFEYDNIFDWTVREFLKLHPEFAPPDPAPDSPASAGAGAVLDGD